MPTDRANRRTNIFAANEHIVPKRDDASHGFAGFRIALKGFVVDALLHFKVSDGFGGVSGLVNVCRHRLIYSDTRFSPKPSRRLPWPHTRLRSSEAPAVEFAPANRTSCRQISDFPIFDLRAPGSQLPLLAAVLRLLSSVFRLPNTRRECTFIV